MLHFNIIFFICCNGKKSLKNLQKALRKNKVMVRAGKDGTSQIIGIVCFTDWFFIVLKFCYMTIQLHLLKVSEEKSMKSSNPHPPSSENSSPRTTHTQHPAAHPQLHRMNSVLETQDMQLHYPSQSLARMPQGITVTYTLLVRLPQCIL